MTELRTLLVVIALFAAATSVAAAERKTIMFRHAPELGTTMTTLPLLAWGPGSMVSSPAVMGRLFPPTLIMQQQSELALSDRQQEAIKAQLREFQSQVVDVQWDLQSSQGDLEALLDADRIDTAAAIAAIDRVLVAENMLKKLHLTLLIEIRNALNPEQIAKLESSFMSFRGWPAPAPTPAVPATP